MSPKATIRAEAEALFAAFHAAGAVPVEADLLLPAETLLDLYGEDIRARAYVTSDPILGEMMLRPDFTVPVVQAHMSGGAEPARYCYMGEVFRKQEHLGNRAHEYLQVGFEVFDRTAPEAADAEVFALFAQMLAGLGLRATTGDIGILMAAVRGCGTGNRTALPASCRLACPASIVRGTARALHPLRQTAAQAGTSSRHNRGSTGCWGRSPPPSPRQAWRQSLWRGR